MKYTGMELMWLFVVYSFFGWVLETAAGTIRRKRFVNRGFTTGPFCPVYGAAAVLMTAALQDLRGNAVFLFLGCAVTATAVEWVTGKSLERLNRKKWWDYSGKRWNFDGYICFQYSVIWGLLGAFTVKWGDEILTGLFRLLPGPAAAILTIGAAAVLFLDLFVSSVTVWSVKRRARVREAESGGAKPGEVRSGEEESGRKKSGEAKNAETRRNTEGSEGAETAGTLREVQRAGALETSAWRLNRRVAAMTGRLAGRIEARVERRMEQAYPLIFEAAEQIAEKGGFAKGCGFYKLFWLFFIGAVLGDLVETVFCRLTAGVWMSRSSLVWGPFSIVWGLAIAAATALLYKDREKPDRHLFVIGTVLGGAYEYICSVFTELVFGTVFWDYSAIPFNLGGRINLLYCFFWGIAAVVWIKGLYPVFSRWIEKIPALQGYVLTWLLVLFMAANMAVSSLALIRYDMRAEGRPARNAVETIIDSRFDDARMEKIYPNALAR